MGLGNKYLKNIYILFQFVLDPLLFLFYINSTHVFFMYADDTTSFRDINSIPEANMHIVFNSVPDNVICWLTSTPFICYF